MVKYQPVSFGFGSAQISEKERKISNVENCGLSESENIEKPKVTESEETPETKDLKPTEPSKVDETAKPIEIVKPSEPQYKKRILPYNTIQEEFLKTMKALSNRF